MSWKSIGKTVAKFAPLLGGVVGGPAGAGIGGIIASAFGVEDKPAAIMNAIKTDPESAIKLRKIELDNKATLENIALSTLQAELNDKQLLVVTINTVRFPPYSAVYCL